MQAFYALERDKKKILQRAHITIIQAHNNQKLKSKLRNLRHLNSEKANKTI